MRADRPLLPGEIRLGSKVEVAGPVGKYQAKLVAARESPVDGPLLLVEDRDGRYWVPRLHVKLAPPPWPVRARAWLKSFIFGEP